MLKQDKCKPCKKSPVKLKGGRTVSALNVKPTEVSFRSKSSSDFRNATVTAWDMLKDTNLHNKYYGSFLIHGVKTIDDFVKLDAEKVDKLNINEEDLPVILNYIH